MAAKDIYLVRHAESEWNAAGRWQGQADPPLSARGRAQALGLAGSFPEAPVTHLFASDLQRARDTAHPLSERFELEVEVDPALRELDVGNWSGHTRDEIRDLYPGTLELFFAGKEGWEGGETYAQHAARADQVHARFEALPDDATVVAVTHGGTLRAIMLSLLGMDPDLRWRFTGIDHIAVTHIVRGQNGYLLKAFNSAHDFEV